MGAFAIEHAMNLGVVRGQGELTSCPLILFFFSKTDELTALERGY